MMEIDYNMSLIDLKKYSDKEIHQILKCTNRDKNEFFRAECTYWMCWMEVNRRNNDKCPEYLDVRCISNIFDDNHNVIFRLGNHYVLYKIENAVLVYNDKWVPYIFSLVEEDDKCIWKYFGLWRER